MAVLDVRIGDFGWGDPPTLDWFCGLCFLSSVAVFAGHAAAIGQSRAALEPYAGRNVLNGCLYMGTVDQHLGLLASAAGDLDTAVERFEASVALTAATGGVAHEARASRTLALALWRRQGEGDAERSREAAEHSWAIARRLGIEPLARQEWPPPDEVFTVQPRQRWPGA